MTSLADIISRSIRWKLLAAMLALVVAQRITFAFIHTRNQNEIVQESLTHRLSLQRKILLERGHALSSDLRRRTENEIAAYNFSSISEDLNDAVQLHSDLSYAILMDAAAVAFVHTRSPELRQTTLATPEDLFAARQAESTSHEHGRGDTAVLEFIEPIRFGDELWGSLRLGFSLAALNREVAQARAERERNSRAFLFRGLRVSALFLVISALLIFWMSRKLTRPIGRLTDSALRLARGDFSAAQDIRVESQDEVGELSLAFITMAGNLKESYTQLEKTVEETRRTGAFLDSILENLPSMVFVKDAKDLRFVTFNRAGEDLLGYSRHDLIGKNDYDFFNAEQADFFTRKDREVLASGKLMDIAEEPIATLNKGQRYLHTRKIVIPDRNAQPQYLLGISEDITALKQAEEQRRLFFTRSLDLLCIADFEGHFLEINPAFVTTLGYTMEELKTLPYTNFIHPDDLEATLREGERLYGGHDTVSFENRYICKDGSLRWLLWSATADLSTRRIYAVARDVTERHELEKQIVQVSLQVQERIARDLHDGLGQILTGLALKGKMMLDDLAAGGAPPSAARAREIVTLANQASEQARALARGLDPVMLREGLPVALQDLAQSTREIFGVNCSFESDRVDVKIDKFESTHLFRIAQEAVNNAVRHAKPGTISIALTSRGGQISLTVSDDGVGLPEGAGESSGMGMRNMRYRARMIGASLSVISNESGGTTVVSTMNRRSPVGDAEALS